MVNRNKLLAAAMTLTAFAPQSRAAVVTAFDDLPGSGSSLIGYAAGTIFGDTLSLAKTGRLDSMTYSVWNGGTGSISSATVTVHLYADTGGGNRIGTSLGSFTQTLAFPTGIGTGTYVLAQATGLGSLASPIALDASNVLVTQEFSNVVSSGNAAPGVIFNSSVAVGSDPTSTQHYVNPPNGFIEFTNPPSSYAQVFQLTVAVPEPALATTGCVVGAFVMHRRRR